MGQPREASEELRTSPTRARGGQGVHQKRNRGEVRGQVLCGVDRTVMTPEWGV